MTRRLLILSLLSAACVEQEPEEMAPREGGLVYEPGPDPIDNPHFGLALIPDPKIEVIDDFGSTTTCESAGVHHGTLCFPTGVATGCATPIELSLGHELSASVTFGPLTVPLDSMEEGQSFSYTSPPCQTCNIEVCYTNTTIRDWTCTTVHDHVPEDPVVWSPQEVDLGEAIYTPNCVDTPVTCECTPDQQDACSDDGGVNIIGG